MPYEKLMVITDCLGLSSPAYGRLLLTALVKDFFFFFTS